MKKLVHGFVVAAGLGLGIGVGQGFMSGRMPSAAWAQGDRSDKNLASAIAEDEAVVQVVKEALPAVVSISNRGDSGSGIIIDRGGVILTNAHVVEGAQRVRIGLADGRMLTGRVVGADQDRDLAVIKAPGNDFPTVRLGDSDRVEVGQAAIAIGDPLGLERTVTRGVISGVDRRPEDFDLDHLLQTDTTINPGNSGGPLLDIRGRVVGINAATLHSRGISGLNFAIPINTARDYARQVMAAGGNGERG